MNTPFLTFLQELRFETIHLAHHWHEVDEEENQLAVAYLQDIYQQEALDYPYQAPDFEAQAALWGAQLLYHAAQAILNRKATLEDLAPLFQGYAFEKTAAAVVAVDLSLRFLPDLLEKLKNINPDDGLILLLEQQLELWPYSAIGYPIQALPQEELANDCLRQLYTDRIIHKKDSRLLVIPTLQQAVKASLGAYQQKIWPDFTFFTTSLSPS